MKNVKELQAIITGILVLNAASEKPCPEIEKLCEYVGGREDIWYATNGEIYEYDTAYKSLRISADERIIHNPTAIDVYLRIDNKNILVKSGDTVKVG